MGHIGGCILDRVKCIWLLQWYEYHVNWERTLSLSSCHNPGLAFNPKTALLSFCTVPDVTIPSRARICDTATRMALS
eukprot:12926987-Prorocentrum_lima.AAC.1